MNVSKKLISQFLTFSFFMCFAAILLPSLSMGGTAEKATANDFTVPLTENGTFHLYDHWGEVIVINLWQNG